MSSEMNWSSRIGKSFQEKRVGRWLVRFPVPSFELPLQKNDVAICCRGSQAKSYPQ